MTKQENVYTFSAFHYDIVQCDRKKVGDRALYDDIDFDWNADINHRFSYWNHSRIWCVTEGAGYVKTTFGEIRLQKGLAYYIPQSTLLETRCDDFMVQYFVDFMPVSDFIPMENLFTFNNVSEDYELILGLIKELMRAEGGVIGNVKKTAIMNMILSRFVKAPSFSVKRDSPMLAVAERINAEYAQKISVANLAKEFGYNSDYFSHVFKETFGISPQRYVINKRVSAAKHLLLTTDKPVGEVALLSGFPDPLYFARIFSKEIGVAPSVFRQSFRRGK